MEYTKTLLNLINELNFNLNYYLNFPDDHNAAKDVIVSLIKAEETILYTPRKDKDLHLSEQADVLIEQICDLKYLITDLASDKICFPVLNEVTEIVFQEEYLIN